MHDVAEGQCSMGWVQGRWGAEDGQLEGQLLTPRRKGAKGHGRDCTLRAAMPVLKAMHSFFAPLRLRVES